MKFCLYTYAVLVCIQELHHHHDRCQSAAMPTFARQWVRLKEWTRVKTGDYLGDSHAQYASHLMYSQLMPQHIVHSMQLLAQQVQPWFELLDRPGVVTKAQRHASGDHYVLLSRPILGKSLLDSATQGRHHFQGLSRSLVKNCSSQRCPTSILYFVLLSVCPRNLASMVQFYLYVQHNLCKHARLALHLSTESWQTTSMLTSLWLLLLLFHKYKGSCFYALSALSLQ